MRGHWDETGTQMTDAIRKAVRDPNIKIRKMPWFFVRILQPVVPFFRQLAEMQYLWQAPIRMNNARLKAALGKEPHTPLDAAVRTTLVSLGCLTGGGKPAAGTDAAVIPRVTKRGIERPALTDEPKAI